MSKTPRCLWLAAIVAAVLSTCFRLGAAEPAADSSAAKPAEASPPAEKALREKSIYIPYEKLRRVFEKQGRGVFLPYEEFDALWRAARDNTKPAADSKPPVGAVITETENEATVSKDVVRVKAVVKIDVLADGWNEIPLRLSDAAITKATIGKDAARIVGQPGEDNCLLVEKKGKQPEHVELVLEYAKSISKMPGQNSVSFQAPQASVSRWRVQIPESGVKVNLFPLIAATEVPAAESKDGGGKKEPKKADETVVLAFVGPAPSVRIDWTPKAEGARGLKALASVQAEQQVSINESSARSRTTLTYTISRAELGQLAIEVPADYKVVNVFDANVRQWAVEPAPAGAKQQKITAQLFEPAKGSQQVTVELEKYTDRKKQDLLSVPVVKALDVSRQQGAIVVQVAPELRAEAANTAGLTQIDAGELPAIFRASKQPWTFAYRYVSVPYDLQLSLEEVQPRITAESLVEALLEPERLGLDVTTVYNIERAGVFKLEFDVPEGYEIRRVRGCEVSAGKGVTAAAAQVEPYNPKDRQKNHLVVNLSRKAAGRVAVSLQLQKDLHEPNLLSPTGRAASIPLPVPQVVGAAVQRSTGRLVVYAPESLQVNPAKVEGLRSVSFTEAAEGVSSASDRQRPAETRPALAFTFAQETPALSLAVERRKPDVSIRQLLVARIEEGKMKYEATFNFTILYSGVKSLRIDVPKDVSDRLRNNSPAVAREKRMDPQPTDVAKGYVAWSFTGDSELIGRGKIQLVWDKNLDRLDVGNSLNVDIPRLMPRGADQPNGQIVLVKAETLDVHETGEPKGVRPIDPQHDLMTSVSGGAAAFAFQGDWSLTATVTRYELQDIKRTSIDRAVVRMVVTRAGETAVQALYRMQSARQRLTVSLPEKAAFDMDPLRINGRPIVPERGQQGEFFVPLLNSSADEPFLLELRYTVPGDAGRMDLPVFPEEGTSQAAMQKVYLCAYLPEGKTLLGVRGPWTQEFAWNRPAGSSKWVPLQEVEPGRSRDQHDDPLISWVADGVKITGKSATNFPTDGLLYVYSSLRPAAPPDGSLSMTVVDDRLFNGAIFVLVALGGVLLLPAGVKVRSLAVAGLVVALILACSLLPTASMQILNGVLFGAIMVVLVIWAVAYVAWTLPAALARRRAAMPPRAEPKLPESPQPAAAVVEPQPQDAAPETPAELPAQSPEKEGGADHA